MQNGIAEKIRKLLALANNNPSMQEAATAAAKAQSLLLEHHLSMQDIDLNEKPEECGKEEVDIGGNTRTVSWRRSLHSVIATHHFCKTIYHTGTTKKTIVGKPSHIAIVGYLYGYLTVEIERQYKHWLRVECFLGKQDLRAFAFGAIAEIGAKFRAERQATQARAGSGCMALVVREDQAVASAFHAFFPHTSTTRPRVNHGAAYAAGKSAGAGMSLRQGVGSNSRGQIS